jgi:hypothetical protein
MSEENYNRMRAVAAVDELGGRHPEQNAPTPAVILGKAERSVGPHVILRKAGERRRPKDRLR